MIRISISSSKQALQKDISPSVTKKPARTAEGGDLTKTIANTQTPSKKEMCTVINNEAGKPVIPFVRLLNKFKFTELISNDDYARQNLTMQDKILKIN